MLQQESTEHVIYGYLPIKGMGIVDTEIYLGTVFSAWCTLFAALSSIDDITRQQTPRFDESLN